MTQANKNKDQAATDAARAEFEAFSKFSKCEWSLDWDEAGFYSDPKADAAFIWFVHGYTRSPLAAAPQAVQAAVPEAIEQMAVDRYKVVPSHESMFHRWAVVAGNGAQQLYIGREGECQSMARKFIGAFLDGAFVAMQNATPAHPAEGVPAPEALEAVTKAILFEDCGSTEGWEENTNLGLAAIRALTQPQQAMAALKAAMADPEYAWSWHCAIWAGAHDEGLETGAANRAAARVMHMAFDCDTTKHANFSPEHLATHPTQQGLDAQDASILQYLLSNAEYHEWDGGYRADFDISINADVNGVRAESAKEAVKNILAAQAKQGGV